MLPGFFWSDVIRLVQPVSKLVFLKVWEKYDRSGYSFNMKASGEDAFPDGGGSGFKFLLINNPYKQPQKIPSLDALITLGGGKFIKAEETISCKGHNRIVFYKPGRRETRIASGF